ncbi:MAG: glycine cleavage system protein H, partial [Syntrophobacteraceae bacterium]
MEKTISITDRIAGMIIATALLVVGMGFMVLGVSLLPVIGIFAGIPVLWLAWRFMIPKAVVLERIAGFLVPNNVQFHPGHAWARVEKNGIITVGMDDFAAKLLGSADSISLPQEGSKVKQGSPGWLMMADSRAIQMLAPVEGEVVAINREVVDSPALAFGDPYGKGWLFKVTNSDPAAD